MYRTESTHYKATGRYFAPPFSISSLYIKLPWLAYTPVRSFIFPITKVHFNPHAGAAAGTNSDENGAARFPFSDTMGLREAHYKAR